MKRTFLLLSFALLGGTAPAADATTLAFFFHNQPATLTQGMDCFQRSDYGGAINNFERYAQSFPQDPEAYYWLGKCYEMTVEPTKTVQALKRYQDLSSQRDLVMGFAKAPEGSKVYAAQLKLDPNYHKARGLYAISLLREGDIQNAKAESTKLLALPQSDEFKVLRKTALILLGEIELSAQRIQTAKDYFTDAIRLGGNTAYPRRKLQEAQEMVEEGVVDEKAQAQFQSMVALAKDLFEQSNYKSALDAIAQALDILPEDGEARRLKSKILGCQRSQDLYGDAETAFRNKELDKAASFAKQALDFNPENILAAKLLTHIQREKSKEK